MSQTRVMVNGREVVLNGTEATPEQIKQAAGVNPNSMLVQQTPDANQFVQPGQRVKLEPGTHFTDVPVFEYGAPYQREIVMTEPDHAALRSHLFCDLSREQHAFLLATPCETPGRLRLLVREILTSTPGDLADQSGAYLQVHKEHTAAILERCYEEGLSLIEAHSHPFCTTGVGFSATDTGNEAIKFPYVAEKIPDIHHATMVFGSESVDAHLWDKHRHSVVPVHRLRIIGHPLHLVPTTTVLRAMEENSGLGWLRRPFAWRSPSPTHDERADRQVLAFGREGQERIAGCRVGIAGAGGLGALVAQMLAYLGCREIVLVDHDHVEMTNLNRLVGATPYDARMGAPKVAVAARMIEEIYPRARVTTVQSQVQTAEAQQALKSCDVIFGALDNHGARLVLNRLAVQYLIPLLDMGTGIRVSPQSPLEAGGQVRLVIPGGFCLECIGGIDNERAAFDLLPPEGRERLRVRGYVDGADVPAPAVIFLNATVASIAVQEFVNLLCSFKPPQHLIAWNAVGAIAGPIAGGERRADCVVCGQGQLLGAGDLHHMCETEEAKDAPVAV